MWEQKQGSSSRTCTPLPDPPAIKELVRAEVQMLLQSLKAKARGERRDDYLDRYETRTLNYVLGGRDCPKSLEDAFSESRADSQCSVQSSIEEDVEVVREKLNATDIDEAVDHIRSVLRHQCEQLQRQVQLIQKEEKQIHCCRVGYYRVVVLDPPHEFYSQLMESFREQCRGSSDAEPTLAELKKLRGALQTDLELCSSPALSAGSTGKDRLSQHSEQRTSALGPHRPVGPRLKSTPSPRLRHSFGSERKTDGPTQLNEVLGEQFPEDPVKKCTFQSRVHELSREGSSQDHVTGHRPPPLHGSTCSCPEHGCCLSIHRNLGPLAENRRQWETCSPRKTVLVDVRRGRSVRADEEDSRWSCPRSSGISGRAYRRGHSQQQSSTFSTQDQSACDQPELKLVPVLLCPKPPLGGRSQLTRIRGSNPIKEGASFSARQSLKSEC